MGIGIDWDMENSNRVDGSKSVGKSNALLQATADWLT
jgi:hypothetical protein